MPMVLRSKRQRLQSSAPIIVRRSLLLDLPQDALMAVLQYFLADVRSVSMMRRVHRQLGLLATTYEALEGVHVLLKAPTYFAHAHVIAESYDARLTALTDWSVHWCEIAIECRGNIGPKAWHMLGTLHSLRSLRIVGALQWRGESLGNPAGTVGNPITWGPAHDTAMCVLRQFKVLATLELSGCPLSFRSVQFVADLARLSGLTTLGISMCNVEDSVLCALGRMVSLTSLDISQNMFVSHIGVGALAALSSLTHLDMYNCIHVDNAALQSLLPLTGLRSLSLNSCYRVGDAGVLALGHMVSMTCLDLSMLPRVTDQGIMGVLSAFPDLVSLNLDSVWRITHKVMSVIVQLPALTCLNLASLPNFGEEGVAWLTEVASLTRLTALDLSRNLHMTNAGLWALGPLVLLRDLRLSGCKRLDTYMIPALLNLSALTSVDFGNRAPCHLVNRPTPNGPLEHITYGSQSLWRRSTYRQLVERAPRHWLPTGPPGYLLMAPRWDPYVGAGPLYLPRDPPRGDFGMMFDYGRRSTVLADNFREPGY